MDEILQKTKRVIQLITPDDQFQSIRLRTQLFEVFITLDLDDLYFVIFQNTNGKRIWVRNFMMIEGQMEWFTLIT